MRIFLPRRPGKNSIFAVLAMALMIIVGRSATALAQDASPCGLVTQEEVEAVIGGPLAGPPFRASNGYPDPSGDSCRYETTEFRAVNIRVEWTDGGTSFGVMNMLGGVMTEGGMKGVLTLSEGTTLTGEWDEARAFMCCEFDALRGEQLVVVDVSGSRASIEQAAALADAALLRLDEPLPVHDAAAVTAAEERARLRPSQRSICELLPRSEAEALAGAPLLAEPSGNDNSCIYTWVLPTEGYEYELKLNVTWRGGFSEMRLAQSAIGQATAYLESEGLTIDPSQEAKPLDEHATTFIGVMGVKHDVFFSVENGGYMNEMAEAFIAAAAGNL